MRLEVDQLLAADGPLAGKMEGFETRPEQVAMARAVQDALGTPHHLLVEAGTGVGKSFAYLLPAVTFATTRHRRVLISTRTIALQEQLIAKDIPFLQSALPVEFTAVLVKGRSNYMSLRRLGLASSKVKSLLRGREIDELHRIEDWAYHTRDGSLADLSPQPDSNVWSLVQSDRHNCMGRRCPSFKKCFYQAARRSAEQADLLVVNHALFFADLALRRARAKMLPDYDVAVLDEGQTIEAVAADHLGMSLSQPQLSHLFNGLYEPRRRKGLLATLTAGSAVKALEKCRRQAETFFADLLAWRRGPQGGNGRLTKEPPVKNILSPALQELGDELQPLGGQMSTDEERFNLSSLVERCRLLALTLEAVLQQEDEEHVYWVDMHGRHRRYVSLHSAPTHVGPLLREALFEAVPSVVLTSATLSTSEEAGFDYLAGRLGAEAAERLKLGSPFDYQQQVALHIERDTPSPTDEAAFAAALPDKLRTYLKMTEGHALVLFTSYGSIRGAAEELREWCAGQGYKLMIQGEELSRSEMLDCLRNEPRSIIFGTESFWNGVDVPGDLRRNVIIVKLPFDVPDRPLIEARMEQIRKAGKNPFIEYQLPEAILRLKQGFGRLIRSKRDRGIVVILDNRVLTKPYGKRFIAALPPCRTTIHGATGAAPEQRPINSAGF